MTAMLAAGGARRHAKRARREGGCRGGRTGIDEIRRRPLNPGMMAVVVAPDARAPDRAGHPPTPAVGPGGCPPDERVDAVFLADAAGDAREGSRGAPMTARKAGSSAEAHGGDRPAPTGGDHRFVFDAERRPACFARSHGTAGDADPLSPLRQRLRVDAAALRLRPQALRSGLGRPADGRGRRSEPRRRMEAEGQNRD